MIAVKNCPLCKSENNVAHTTAVGKPKFETSTPIGNLPTLTLTSYRQCLDCGMVFQSPRMDEENLLRYYEGGYYRQWLDMTQADMDKDEAERALSVMASINSILKTAGRVLSTHLDVGCSRGYLMRQTAKAGFRVVGTEWNLDYVEDDVKSKVTDHMPDGTFDLMTSIHVLEHVSDPLKELKSYFDHLEHRGYAVIEVPGTGSLGGPFRLAHLHYFPPYVLKAALLHVGFEIVAYVLTPHQRFICRRP